MTTAASLGSCNLKYDINGTECLVYDAANYTSRFVIVDGAELDGSMSAGLLIYYTEDAIAAAPSHRRRSILGEQ
jgi:hypothetical protein